MAGYSDTPSDVEELLDTLNGDREREAFVYGDRRLTVGEVVDTVHRLAHTLDGRVGPGDIVTLLVGNAPEGIIARHACNLLGAGVTQPHEGLSAATQARIVDDVDSVLVLVDAQHTALAREVLDRAHPVDVSGLGTTGPDGTWTDLLAASADAPVEPIRGRSAVHDVQQIRHTGGTTGHPKGITYTFGHHARSAHVRERMTAFQPERDNVRMLLATPTAHAGGAFADRMLAAGATVVLQDGFDAGAFLAAVERERITDSWLLPPLIYRLLDHPDLDATDTSSLVSIVYGGAPANAGRIREAIDRIGPVFVQVYGQTEAGGISMLTPEEHARPELLGTVGHPIPTTDVEVRADDGTVLPAGERGLLWVRTGMEMDGYWKQPDRTAETIVDGWVRTGDVAFLDDEGYLHLVDRASDVVVVVGGHVYTSELEDVLMEHDGVRQAAVFGGPAGDGSEAVYAAVLPADPAPTERELTEHVARESGDMYVPHGITFVDRMPLTDVGKTDKKVLRERITG